MDVDKMRRLKVAAREMIEMNMRVTAFGLVFVVIPLLSWTFYAEQKMTNEDKVKRRIEREEKKRRESWDE